MRLIDSTYAELRAFLMADFRGLKASEAREILNDFEKAVVHVTFELQVKLSLWQQLPLILAAMGEDDNPLAVQYLKMAVDQYEHTKASTRHCPLTHEYLADDSAIRPCIMIFIETQAKTPLYIKHGNGMKMIRTKKEVQLNRSTLNIPLF